MILLLVITDGEAYGVHVRRHKIVDSFPVQSMENLKNTIGKRSYVPLVVCWDLSVLYLLKKNSIPMEPQLLKVGNGGVLYTTDQQQIELWIKVLRDLKNPIKAMALVQRTSEGISLQTSVYTKALQVKAVYYWLRRLVYYSSWIFCVMALGSLGFKEMQYNTLQKEVDQGTQRLEQLEKSYLNLNQEIHWTSAFCEVIEELERKINGDV